MQAADRRDVVTRHLADSMAVTHATAGRYRGAGFAIRSDIDFSILLNGPIADHGPADVGYCRGGLPSSGAGFIFRRFITFCFAAIEGRRVVVSVWAGRHYEAVSRSILAGGLNAVAYQRGLLPLHASAVAVG